ncbi:hypothetical protein P3T29_002433 [Kitasatospora sp. MAP5-34]|nr:hypothetical protein [Kitasatospora sp. MAP5-34]
MKDRLVPLIFKLRPHSEIRPDGLATADLVISLNAL